jgi:hypothetical protein
VLASTDAGLLRMLASHSWWAHLTRKERVFWLLKSGSDAPCSAYDCFLLSRPVQPAALS